MKQLLIYERPLALNRMRHRNLRIRRRINGFTFAARLNSVPLVCCEFPTAARDYPIVFAGTPTKPGLPVALLGLTGRDNLFVAPSGQWAQGMYVPAFLRRYPFVVAEPTDSDDGFVVCIDEAVVGHGDGEDLVRLFDENGNESPLLQRAVRFLTGYQGQLQRTRAFVKTLIEHELLVTRKVELRRVEGRPLSTLHGFCVVNEAKLRALNGSALKRLSETGALGLAHAHLMSLRNMQRLLARFDARQAQPGRRAASR